MSLYSLCLCIGHLWQINELTCFMVGLAFRFYGIHLVDDVIQNDFEYMCLLSGTRAKY